MHSLAFLTYQYKEARMLYDLLVLASVMLTASWKTLSTGD